MYENNDLDLDALLEQYKEESLKLDLECSFAVSGDIIKQQYRLLKRKTNPNFISVINHCNKAIDTIEDKLLSLAENKHIGIKDKPIPVQYLIYVRLHYEYKDLLDKAKAFQNYPKPKVEPDIKEFFNDTILLKQREEIQKVFKKYYSKNEDHKIALYLSENATDFKLKPKSKTHSFANFFKILLVQDYNKNRVDRIRRKYEEMIRGL